jgi:N-acetylneuraminate synthase
MSKPNAPTSLEGTPPKTVPIGGKEVGPGQPTFVVAEIGINHNGDLDVAKKLIDAAFVAGCDAVKFQKRTPEICVPPDQRERPRETPWGVMTYMEYRERLELGQSEYAEIDRYCREKGIAWLASCWDVPSVDFIERFDPVGYKVASACLTDDDLLRHTNAQGRPIILSTGMSTMAEIRRAVALLDRDRLVITHTTSSYPCAPADLNLRMIPTLAREFGCPVGYSGHEVGLQTTIAAVALGAALVERHVTLDRAMWGSDQAASVEPWGVMRLVRDIRVVETAMGDGRKRVYDSELPLMERLRR